MPKITFIDTEGTRREVDAPIGLSVLEIAHKNDIDLEGACEGSLACSTCHVIVEPEWYDLLAEASEDEEDMLDLAFGLTKTSRLGCQIIMSEELDGLTLKLPAGTRNMQAAEAGCLEDGSTMGLFDRLREAAGEEWTRYTCHEFVRRLGDGSLQQAAFRHYLIQDYLFLIHFARAYALAVYKSETLADMRQAGASLSAILDLEMGLHVKYCAGWGLDEDAMAAAPEATGTLAYTRFVLERGMAGDMLDLQVALAPCIVGYAEIAAELMADPATKLEGNPYRDWIEMYAGEEYREVAAARSPSSTACTPGAAAKPGSAIWQRPSPRRAGWKRASGRWG